MDAAYDKIMAALSGSRRKGDNWSCPGPLHGHGDARPSLQVTRNNIGVGLYCHTGCSTEDVVQALGLRMRDLSDDHEISREIAEYDYHDLDGTVVYAKVRYEPKTFSIKHPSAHGWQPGMGTATRLLYRLPWLVEGVAAGKTVYVVEGEKDADRLADHGYVATTNFEGAGKWRSEYNEFFRDANVTVIADRDEPGYAHAMLVKQNLHGIARRVKVVQSKTENKKDDVSDHLNAGFGVEELVPLTAASSAVTSLYNPVNWFHVWKETADEPDWLFEPILEAGTVNALFGRPGVGKSLITLEMAMTIAKNGRPVVYIDDENRIQDTVERLKAFSCRPEDIDKLYMYSFAGLPALDTPDGGQHLAALADRHEAALVVLDTTSRMVAGDENAASTYLQLYRCSLVPLKSRGITVLRLDHPGKDDSRGQRGSSAKLGDIDTLWKLSSESEDLLTLEREKSRSGHGEAAIVIKRLHNPLRHDWDALESLPVTGDVLAWAQKFDDWGVSRDAGRPTLRAILEEKNGACSNATLSVVARYRKKLGTSLSANSDNTDSDDGCPF